MAGPSAGIIQFDVKKGGIKTNVAHVLKSLKRLAAKGANLVVLPEMWSSGFDYVNLSVHAEKTPEILEKLAGAALTYNMVIAGTLPEKTKNGIYNTTYVLDEKGAIAARYRKVHLFLPGGEGRFAPGEKSVVVKTSLGLVGLLTCYDLRFPEQCRVLVLGGAKIILLSAQWPDVRIHHWDVLLKARAIENQAFVIAANRCGQDKATVFGGRSQIISPMGEVLAKANKRGGHLIAPIDLNQVRDFRKQIPCLKDRAPGAYEIQNIDKN